MPRLDQLSDCPSCAEPLESGDLFCGACGTDLSVAAARERPDEGDVGEGSGTGGAEADRNGSAGDHPTLALPMNGIPVPDRPPADQDPEVRSRGRGQHQGQAPAPDSVLPPTGEPTARAVRPPQAATHPAQPPTGTDATAERATAAAPPDPRVADPRTADPRTADPHASTPRASDPTTPDTPAPDTRAPGSRTPDPRTAGPLGTAPLGTGPLGARKPAAPPGPRCVACGTGAIDPDGYCDHCGHAQPRERDHMERELEGVAAASDRGLRHHRNEDFFSVSATALPDGSPAVVAVVCDGVSSASRPDEASAAAAETANESLLDSLPRGTPHQQAMHDALMAAAEAVTALAAEDRNPAEENAPACTIVSAVITRGTVTVGWVGDSRAYWVPRDRDAPPARLTEDDSWASQMVAAGLMEEAEAYADPRAHAITGWLGADAFGLQPHTTSFAPDRPGVVVVCTDGLWNYAESAEQLAAALPAPGAAGRPLHTARHLVGYALDGGGHDNITVAVLPFPAPPGRTGRCSGEPAG